MFENPRRAWHTTNFTTNVPKTLDLKSSSEQIFSRKMPLGAPETCCNVSDKVYNRNFSGQLTQTRPALATKTAPMFEL